MSKVVLGLALCCSKCRFISFFPPVFIPLSSVCSEWLSRTPSGVDVGVGGKSVCVWEALHSLFFPSFLLRFPFPSCAAFISGNIFLQYGVYFTGFWTLWADTKPPFFKTRLMKMFFNVVTHWKQMLWETFCSLRKELLHKRGGKKEKKGQLEYIYAVKELKKLQLADVQDLIKRLYQPNLSGRSHVSHSMWYVKYFMFRCFRDTWLQLSPNVF